MRGRITHILAVIATITLLAKVLLYTSIFSPTFVFDEVYYVTSAKYILYKLGALQHFTPPISTNVTISGNTIYFNVSIERSMNAINILMGSYDWLNLEHPILGKLLIGAIVLIRDDLVFIRFVLLGFSLLAFYLFIHTFFRKYGLLALVSFALFVLLDWVYVHFTYLAVLDTIMLVFLLPSFTYLMNGKQTRSIIFLSLSVAVKEFALFIALSYAVYFYLRKEKRYALSSIIIPVIALILSYSGYLLFTTPDNVLNAFIGLGHVMDPFACKYMCLLSLCSEWGVFKLYSPLIWVWFAGLVVITVRDKECGGVPPEDALPYYMSMILLLFLLTISFSRSIYVYYYAVPVLLSIYPLADILCFAKDKLFCILIKKSDIISGGCDEEGPSSQKSQRRNL